MTDNKKGDTELRVDNLVLEIFKNFNKPLIDVEQSGEDVPILYKDEIKEYIHDMMRQAGEDDAWDDEEFEHAFKEFDYDGNGEVDPKELVNLVKKFADLWYLLQCYLLIGTSILFVKFNRHIFFIIILL